MTKDSYPAKYFLLCHIEKVEINIDNMRFCTTQVLDSWGHDSCIITHSILTFRTCGTCIVAPSTMPVVVEDVDARPVAANAPIKANVTT